uniref:Uncharacterized protein n=1 Tax=Arcella intermedia TaxID=1963864 RepID=A0A6B2LCY4_9EUKA
MLTAKLEVHQGWVTTISFSKAGNYLATGGRDHTLTLCPLTSQGDQFQGPFHRLEGHGGIISNVICSNDPAYFLSSSWDKTIRIWDTKERSIQRVFPLAHSDVILCVSLSSDDRVILTCSRDRTLKLWNTLGECKYTITEEHPIYDTKLIGDVIYYSHGTKLSRFNVKTSARQLIYTGNDEILYFAVPNSKMLFLVESKSVLVLVDLKSKEVMRKMKLDCAVCCMAPHPLKYYIAFGHDEGIVLLDVRNKTIIKTALIPGCLCLAWDKEGKFLFSGHKNGFIKIWK